MNRLKIRPTSVPLPPLPTIPLEGSYINKDSVSSRESLILPESNFTKVLKSLKKSSTFPLQQKASSPSPTTSPVVTPQREAPKWPFRHSGPSSVLAAASRISVSELGDHFVRIVPSYAEVQARLKRRRKATEERVKKMRAYLGVETPKLTVLEVVNPFVAKERTGKTRSHQRIDSGSHERADSNALHGQQKPDATSTSATSQNKASTLVPLTEDFLSYSLMRKRDRSVLEFDCVACQGTHRTSLQDAGAVVWILHGCRHLLHEACFRKMRDLESLSCCYNCEVLARKMQRYSRDEMALRHKRLLKETRTDY